MPDRPSCPACLSSNTLSSGSALELDHRVRDRMQCLDCGHKWDNYSGK